VGLGGLGHMGLKFAKAFGCERGAFSTTFGWKDGGCEAGLARMKS